MTEIRFFVSGIPAPGGSKSAFVPTNKKTGQPYRTESGRIIVNVTDAGGKRTKRLNSVPLTGAIEVELIFHMPRPKSHFASNGIALRPQAPLHHVCRPDCLKLARSTEDACTGILWRDDAQIVKETIEKFYSDQSGAWIIVREVGK